MLANVAANATARSGFSCSVVWFDGWTRFLECSEMTGILNPVGRPRMASCWIREVTHCATAPVR
jgi:hypothetical protein